MQTLKRAAQLKRGAVVAVLRGHRAELSRHQLGRVGQRQAAQQRRGDAVWWT